MLQVSKTTEDGVTRATLQGVITEDASLALLDPIQGPLEIHCGDVTRINSVGSKQWWHYFSGLRKQGVKLTFVGCPEVLIEQANMIPGMLLKHEVLSFYASYFCDPCQKSRRVLIPMEAVARDVEGLAHRPCPECSKEMDFDEIPEFYLGFLK